MTIVQAAFYAAFVVILLIFWGRVRGRSFTALMDEIRRKHEHVHHVMAYHAQGGSWPEVRRWLEETPQPQDTAPSPRA